MESSVSSAGVLHPHNNEGFLSGVSWGAVIAGAFVVAASSLILLALGAGMGLSAVSPWSDRAGSAVGALTIIWLIVIEIVASALGGYITGRLRTKWAVIHTDEVYFRDTANGFLAWAVALVMTVTFLVSATASMAGGDLEVRAKENTGTEASAVAPNGYFVDRLFRSGETGPEDVSSQGEAARILAYALRHDGMAAEDQDYLARVIAAHTGLPVSDAAKRVSDVVAEARQAEESARKETARLLLWFFLSLLIGAFSASYAATVGGRQRDHVKPI
jgi:hypothetical protein